MRHGRLQSVRRQSAGMNAQTRDGGGEAGHGCLERCEMPRQPRCRGWQLPRAGSWSWRGKAGAWRWLPQHVAGRRILRTPPCDRETGARKPKTKVVQKSGAHGLHTSAMRSGTKCKVFVFVLARLQYGDHMPHLGAPPLETQFSHSLSSFGSESTQWRSGTTAPGAASAWTHASKNESPWGDVFSV